MTTTQNFPNTPGFNCHLNIRFRTDRNGRLYAEQTNVKLRRWVRVNRQDAELWIAQGLATKVEVG